MTSDKHHLPLSSIRLSIPHCFNPAAIEFQRTSRVLPHQNPHIGPYLPAFLALATANLRHTLERGRKILLDHEVSSLTTFKSF